MQAGVFRAPKWPCYTPVISLGMLPRRAWYAPSAGNMRNNTIFMSNLEHTLYITPDRNCEQIRKVWLTSADTVIAAWNPVRPVSARRGLGLLDFEGSRLPISIASWPSLAVRGWLLIGRLVAPRNQTNIPVGVAGRHRDWT